MGSGHAERAWMQSKPCFNLQKLAADMLLSGCPRSLVGLSSTRSSRSGGLVLALSNADADGILNRKTDRHAELEGILICMGDKDRPPFGRRMLQDCSAHQGRR